MTVLDLTPDENLERSSRDESPAVIERPTVELLGRHFPLSDQPVPALSLMKLAALAKRQAAQGSNGPTDGVSEMEQLSIIYELVQATIAPDAWPAFEAHATATRAGVDELQAVIRSAVTTRTSFPTQPSSVSPDGRSTTGTSSSGASSSPGASVPMGSIEVQHDLEQRGRPDLALVVLRAREASSGTSTG
jgi:hypothetical protein